MKKSKLKQWIIYLFTLILTVLFVSLFVCIGINYGVLNSRSIRNNLHKSNYYHSVYEELNERALDLFNKSGLPITVLTNVLSPERVGIAGRNYIEAVLSGKEPNIKTDRLREELTNQIDLYYKEHSITLTKEETGKLDQLISLIEEDYVGGIELPLLNYIREYQDNFQKLMLLVLPILIILIGVLCYFIIRMHHHRYRGVRDITYSILAASLLTIVGAYYLLLSGSYKEVEALPVYYQKLITTLLEWDIRIFIYIGGLGIILSILLISLERLLKNRTNN